MHEESDGRRLTIDARHIFDEAVELSAEQRERFIERSCQGRGDLEAFVRRLLRAHDEAGDFMHTPTGGGASSKPPEPATTPPAQAGTRVGPFELVRRIGEGAFGEVYLARQLEPVQRDVAVKLLRAGLDSRYVLGRFETERQALAMLDHPNIARLLDAGTAGDGRPFFAMQLVRGTRITEYADANRLSVRERVRLLIGACRGVQHAHDAGLVHRDLKPANILVEVRDDRATARVIDFGIARAVRASVDATQQTLHGQVLGTPAYMAPEQARGGADVDARADVYSLGCVLYELLAGVTPIEPGELRQAGDLARAIEERTIAPPSDRVAGLGDGVRTVARLRNAESSSLGRLLAGELDWICARALARAPRERYASAGALADDLHRWLEGRAVEAVPGKQPVRRVKRVAGRYAWRLRYPAVAAGVLLVIVTWAMGWIPGVPGFASLMQRTVEDYASGRRYGLPEGAWVNGMRTNRAGGRYSLVGGGSSNSANDDNAMVGGGIHNSAGGESATIGGGRQNTVQGEQSVIAGGKDNLIRGGGGSVGGGWNNHALSHHVTIAGGRNNEASGYLSTIGGGEDNQAHDSRATISGGSGNTAGVSDFDPTNADGSTIGGGINNHVRWRQATVAGGIGNTAYSSAAAVGGGAGNVAGDGSRNDGAYATVPGGLNNRAEGLGSFAAGVAAKALHDGAFVWADTDLAASNLVAQRPPEGLPIVVSQGDQSFTARARGGFHLFTTIEDKVVLGGGDPSWSHHLAADTQRDRQPIDAEATLEALRALDLATYTRDGRGDRRHLGPTAEALGEAFGIGEGGHVPASDVDGVALAAIQALLARVEAQDAELRALHARLEALEAP